MGGVFVYDVAGKKEEDNDETQRENATNVRTAKKTYQDARNTSHSNISKLGGAVAAVLWALIF